MYVRVDKKGSQPRICMKLLGIIVISNGCSLQKVIHVTSMSTTLTLLGDPQVYTPGVYLKVGGIDFFQYRITIPTNTSVLLKTD